MSLGKEKSSPGLNGPLRTNSVLIKSVKTGGQSAGSFGGAATVLFGSELLVSAADCTPLVVLVLTEAACTSPGSVTVFLLSEDVCTVFAEAGCIGFVLELAETACTSPGSVLVLAEDCCAVFAEAGCSGSVLVLAEAGCVSTESVLVLADGPASPLLTNLSIAPANYR